MLVSAVGVNGIDDLRQMLQHLSVGVFWFKSEKFKYPFVLIT